MAVTGGYRVRQFFQAVGSWLQADQTIEAAAGHLPPAALCVFCTMARYDRRHAVSVLQTLQERGYTQPELLAAALLHDAGKTVFPPGAGGGTLDRGRLRLWHRVAVVLMGALWPALLIRLGGEAGTPGWRTPFYVQRHHAAISAELARQAGCSDRTVDLIRRHEEAGAGAEDPLLAALQAADNEN